MMDARRRMKDEPVAFNIEFDGVVQMSVRARLIIELIKFILYHRQQIPQTYEQLKKDQETHDISTGDSRNESHQRTATSKFSRMPPEGKKRKQLVSSLSELFAGIHEIFTTHSVPQIVLVLGATIVSPKETYVISLPTDFIDGDLLTEKSCVRQLCRKLVTNDIYANAKNVPITNMNVLLQTNRNNRLAGFQPRPNFNVPKRGKQFFINLSCSNKADGIGEDLSCLDTPDIEMSGIEPLDVSDFDDSAQYASGDFASAMSKIVDGVEHMNCGDAITGPEGDADQLIWFQALSVVKGYRDKTTKTASCSDMWV